MQAHDQRLGAPGGSALPRTTKATRDWVKNVASFWGALDADFALAASVQSTLASGASSELRFGATESCARKFHADVEA